MILFQRLLSAIALVTALPAAAQEQCALDLSVLIVDEAGGRTLRNTQGENFYYGEQFEVRAYGTHPGLFCFETVNPQLETLRFDPIVSDGTYEVRLPCGADSICDAAVGPQFFEFQDDAPGGPKGLAHDEAMLLRYFPCRSDDAASTLDITGDLPLCSDAPRLCPPRPARLASHESIVLSKPRIQGCTVEDDLLGRPMLHQTLHFRVYRQ